MTLLSLLPFLYGYLCPCPCCCCWQDVCFCSSALLVSAMLCPEVAMLYFSFLHSVLTQLSNIYAKTMPLVSENNKNAIGFSCASCLVNVWWRCAHSFFFLCFVCVFVFNRKRNQFFFQICDCSLVFPSAQLVSASYYLVSGFFAVIKAEIKFSPKHQLCSSSKVFNAKAKLLAHIW